MGKTHRMKMEIIMIQHLKIMRSKYKRTNKNKVKHKRQMRKMLKVTIHKKL
jgi:hypothetical protein